MMKILTATIAAMVILAGPAHAQMFGGNPSSTVPGNPADREVTAKTEKERADIEKEYDQTMKRLKTQGPAPKSDPWGRIRPGTDAKR
jgi:hypothetical protein